MSVDPRAALDRLVATLEGHLHAASNRRGEADPAVVAAYQAVADAFEIYDDALYTAYDEVTPFVLYDDVEDEEDDRDDEEEDDEEDLDDADDEVEIEDDEINDEIDDEIDDDEEVDDVASRPYADRGPGAEASSKA